MNRPARLQPRALKLGMRIRQDGDTWKIIGLGRDGHPDHPGAVFCHLASCTRFRPQKNGSNPIQIGTWVKGAKGQTVS